MCALLLSDFTADIYAVLGCSGLIKNSYNRKTRYRGDKVSIQIWGGWYGKADRGRHICGGRYDEAAMDRQIWEGMYGKAYMGIHMKGSFWTVCSIVGRWAYMLGMLLYMQYYVYGLNGYFWLLPCIRRSKMNWHSYKCWIHSSTWLFSFSYMLMLFFCLPNFC